MKKTYIILLTIVLALSGILPALSKSVEITNPSVRKAGDNVNVTFDISFGSVSSDYKVIVTPFMQDSKGNAKKLMPVTFLGKRKSISDRRAGNSPQHKVVLTRKMPRKMKYNLSVPFEDWMQWVSLSVEQSWEGCCETTEIPPRTLVDSVLLYYNPEPLYDKTPLVYELTELEKYDLENPFLHPMEDYDKRYDILMKDREKGSSIVYFKVGSHNLEMDYMGNDRILAAIARAFELIASDPNASLKHIMVAGYASPEGSLAFNTRLAQNRAESVKKYIQSDMGSFGDLMFEVYNGREDWGGLREKVDKSDMAERNSILTIIDGYTMEEEIRKSKLQQYGGGAAYKYMLQNFYPALRNAGYVQVYYEIDRKATIATAFTDELGRTTWVDPDSPSNRGVTAINKAVKLMIQDRYTEALDVMSEFTDDKRAFNNIGVCYLMTGNAVEAEKYFRKALAEDDPYAEKNLLEALYMQQIIR